MKKDTVLSRLDIRAFYAEAVPSLRDTGMGEATGLCPFHDDHRPSLSVNLETGLWCCHAGCGGGDVFAFVMKRDQVGFAAAVNHVTRRNDVSIQGNIESRRRVRAHRWQDTHGHDAWHVRWSAGAKFTWAQDAHGTRAGKGQCETTLYGLEAVRLASAMILVEGEHDADTINAWLDAQGQTVRATCTPNGAADVKAEYMRVLEGTSRVWVSGDNDAAGQQYLEQCGSLLRGTVGEVRRLPVPEGSKDWAEWAERGGTADAFCALLEQAAVFISTVGEAQAPRHPEPERAVTRNSSPADVADAFLDTHEYRAHDGLRLRWYRNEWHGYDSKVFVPMRTEELRAEIMAFLQGTSARSKAKNGFVGDVLGNLAGLCRMVPPSVTLPAMWTGGECRPQPDTVVVQNGRVDLRRLFEGDTDEVLALHTPSFVSTVCLPFDYDPKAQCPGWRMFLEQVLPDPESQQLLQDIFGYCLTFDTSQQKFFMFEGGGANGKGVVLRVLTLLLGEANVSGLPLESFGATHGLELTLGKLVNLTSEIGDLASVAEGLLKQFTGEDLMTFNPKYRPAFSAKVTARLIMATNVRPPFKDRSEGLWRRLIVLPFSVTIPEAQRNTRLTEQLATELSGIFNWAVEGARSLRQRGHFLEPASSREAREAFQREANAARLFLEERYVTDPNGEIEKQELYREYKAFCDECGYKPLHATNFAREVERLFPAVKEARPRGLSGSRSRTYRGIGLRRDTEDQEGNMWNDYAA